MLLYVKYIMNEFMFTLTTSILELNISPQITLHIYKKIGTLLAYISFKLSISFVFFFRVYCYAVKVVRVSFLVVYIIV